MGFQNFTVTQAEKLREKLASMKISKDALWVSSPMTRALETMLLGCPLAKQIGAAQKPLNVAVRRSDCLTAGSKTHECNAVSCFLTIIWLLDFVHILAALLFNAQWIIVD